MDNDSDVIEETAEPAEDPSSDDIHVIDSRVQYIQEDMAFETKYSKAVSIRCPKELESTVLETLERIPCKTRISQQSSNCKVQVEFPHLMFAVVFRRSVVQSLVRSGCSVDWVPAAPAPLRLPGKGRLKVCLVSLGTLDHCSVESGVQRVLLKVCLHTDRGLLTAAVMPVEQEPGVLEALGIEVRGVVATLHGTKIIESVQAKPKLVLHRIVSDLYKRLRNKRRVSAKHLLIFHSWDDAAVFLRLHSGFGERSDLDAYVSHVGVLNNGRLGINLDTDPGMSENLNTVEKNIHYQYMLENIITSDGIAEEFINRNCVPVSRNLRTLALPAVVSELLCFLTLEFVSVHGFYHLTALDACLSDLKNNVDDSFFFPVKLDGTDPAVLHGKSYNPRSEKYEYRDTGRSFHLVGEKRAIAMALRAVRDVSKGSGTLVLLNPYLSLPPLLAVVRRHALEETFYSSFSSLVDLDSLVCTHKQFDGLDLKEVHAICKPVEPELSESVPVMMRTICAALQEGLKAVAKPISEVRYSTEHPQYLSVVTDLKCLTLKGSSSVDISCRILDQTLLRSPRTFEFVLVMTPEIPKQIILSFSKLKFEEGMIDLRFRNDCKKEFTVNFESGRIGTLQLRQDLVGIQPTIPHLQGLERTVFRSTDRIRIVKPQPEDHKDHTGNSTKPTSPLPTQAPPSSVIEKSSSKALVNKPPTLVDPPPFYDVILVSFLYDGGWFMRVNFRSVVLGGREVSLVTRPDYQLCITCNHAFALHATDSCPALRWVRGN